MMKKLHVGLLVLVTIHQLNAQKLIRDFGNNHITTSAISFTSDGKLMLIGGFAKSFDTAGGQVKFRTVEKDTETLEDFVYTVDISPDNKSFLIAKISRIELWDINTGSRKKVIKDSKLVENAACYSRNGEGIVYLRKNGEVVIVSSSTYKVIKKQKVPTSAPLTIAAAPAGDKVLIGTKESAIILYDLITYNLSVINMPVAETRLIRFSSDGRLAAGASLTGKIWMADYPSLESVNAWQAHPEGLTAVSFHPSGRYLASGGKDKMIKIWSIPECSEIASWEAHKLAIASVEFTPDGSGIASGSVNDVIAKGGEDTKLWSFDAPSPIKASIKAENKVTRIPKQDSPVLIPQKTSQKRLALIIGNGNYQASVLANPENDAREMKSILEQYGFDVLKYENLNQSQMKKAMDDFGEKLKNYDVGLFFYAGHGIQAKGYNYLIPVDADLRSEEQVEYDCVQADRILGLMEASGTKVNIMILDACRNNPFERSWTRAASGRGLAYMNAPAGTLIAYATAPGSTASDGSGSNGLYTSAILESIKIPDITILQMFQNVRSLVSQQSNKQQVPWESTSLTGDFYFQRINPD
jgi:hypothetical protein